MDTLLYWVVSSMVALLQALPLDVTARLGRAAGVLAYLLDKRHRRVALRNLTRCFGAERSPAEIEALVRENFRRIGENFACAVKTAAMTPAELAPHFKINGVAKILPHETNAGPQSRILVIGHFGNFELYARFGQFMPAFKCATTYRGLRQPALNRLMQSLRERSGCRFFERRSEAAALKAAMCDTGLLLGLLADQHAGDNGLRLPFLDEDCSTSAAPAVFALRYNCPLHPSICYRVGLARWEIEVGDEIPTHENGHARTVEAIMLDVNHAFEKAVRRDPANWFWVHDRWKPARPKPAAAGEEDTGGGFTMSAQPRRILVRGVNWLGDAVMTTPALLRLREKFPGAQITLLTPGKLRDLWARHPALDEAVSFAADESVFAVGRRLRAGGFDLAIVLPNSPRSALEPWLAGIPQRIGYARAWRNWFLTQAVPTRPGHVRMHKRSETEIKELVSGGISSSERQAPGAMAHQIHEYLNLMTALGASPEPLAPRLFIAPDEVATVKEKFGLAGITQPIFGLNPGAEYGPAKRWPVDKFIAAAREIQQRTNCVWLVFGGKADAETAGRIETGVQGSKSKVQSLAGKTTLRELMALLKCCQVLLTNDTGPMHVAAALDTPVVVPFGSTSLELTGPGLPGDTRHQLIKSDAPCAPCFLRECPIDFRCLNGIGVDRVVSAVLACV